MLRVIRANWRSGFVFWRGDGLTPMVSRPASYDAYPMSPPQKGAKGGPGGCVIGLRSFMSSLRGRIYREASARNSLRWTSLYLLIPSHRSRRRLQRLLTRYLLSLIRRLGSCCWFLQPDCRTQIGGWVRYQAASRVLGKRQFWDVREMRG